MVKILFLCANPSDTTQLRLGEEVRQIDLKIRLSKLRDEFELRSHWAVRAGDLPELFQRHAPDVVHFSGHGSASSELILEDDSNYGRPISASALRRLFTILGRNIRCVVLNSCYCEPQAGAIAEHIDCVVGMAKAISDEAAINFSAAFYHALGYGQSIQEAFDLGCLNINLMNPGEEETPKLFCPRTDPRRLFLVSDERAAGTRRQLEDLARGLIEGDAHERAIIAQILFISPSRPLAGLLIERSATDPHPMVRSWLNRALGRLKTTEAVEALRRNAADHDPLAALGAEDALSEIE